MAKYELTIDPEFAALCPALTQEEHKTLTAELIAANGPREKIVTWANHDDTILDGHQRYGICQEHELNYEVRPLKFETRAEAKNWIIRNQLGRRNATEEQKAYLRGKLYIETKGDPQENLKNSRDFSKGQNDPSRNTAAQIAEETGVSPATVKRDAAFAEAIDVLGEKSPELKAAALAGEIAKADVPKLAEQPKRELKKVAAKPPKERKKAAKELTREEEIQSRYSGNGRGEPTADARKFKDITDAVGKLVRMNTELVKHCGGKDHHESIRTHLNAILVEIKAWQKSAKAT